MGGWGGGAAGRDEAARRGARSGACARLVPCPITPLCTIVSRRWEMSCSESVPASSSRRTSHLSRLTESSFSEAACVRRVSVPCMYTFVMSAPCRTGTSTTPPGCGHPLGSARSGSTTSAAEAQRSRWSSKRTWYMPACTEVSRAG